MTATGDPRDPYATGAYDDYDIGEGCRAEDCRGEMPDGWCRTCERTTGWGEGETEAKPLCMVHLTKHCVEQGHTAWLTKGTESLVGYLADTQLILATELDTLERISAEVVCLDDLQARGLISMPKQYAASLHELEEARDAATATCCALHDLGHKLEHKPGQQHPKRIH